MAYIALNDLISQETKRNPAAFFARLRAQAPLCRVENFAGYKGAFIAMNYDDVQAILKDPRFGKERPKDSRALDGSEPTPGQAEIFAWRRDMLTVDPPDHTRLRSLVSKAFTPRMIEQLRPRIQEISDELLHAVQHQGQMDLINDFAFPLPITVISELLGIPKEDRQKFRVWTQAIIGQSGQMQNESVGAVLAFVNYIKGLVAEKRAHPGSDLTSGLVHAEEAGDSLSEHELISTMFLLIVAGHETTVNLIGNGTLALLHHPEQLQLLRSDPSLIPQAVEELLRYTAPVSLSTPRWALEDIPLHGQVIRKGEMVLGSLIGANTDPQHVPSPEQLDVLRAEQKHLAFGKGIHFCLGAPLARLEGQIAFATLLSRLPELKLACALEDLHFTASPILRGLSALPVTCRPTPQKPPFLPNTYGI
jgi:cytochrome P450 PksS